MQFIQQYLTLNVYLGECHLMSVKKAVPTAIFHIECLAYLVPTVILDIECLAWWIPTAKSHI